MRWEGKEVTPSIVKTNEWTEIKHELIFEKPINNPGFNIGFYVWNKGDYEVFIDDMKLDVME